MRKSAIFSAVFSHAPDFSRPSKAARDKARRLLDRAMGPSKVATDEETCARYARDDSEAHGVVPDAVVHAATGGDLLAALRIAREAEVPITPRGAGTGRTGGAVPAGGGIVLNTTGLASIKEINRRDGVAVVEPGVVLADLQRAVENEGWFYPPDPSSVAECCLGGNVAENAGGPRAFKYGVTRNWVLGIEAFLIGGQRLRTGRRTTKGVTGYDVTALLVGSEGTLAVFGDITLRLMPKPACVMTMKVLFADVRVAAACVEEAVAAGLSPRCIELLDGLTLAAMRRAGNEIDARAGAMLIVEFDGDEGAVEREAKRFSAISDDSGAVDVTLAGRAGEVDLLWSARRGMSRAVRSLANRKLSEDVVVPRQHIGALLAHVDRLGERERVRHLTYGHAGDGNLHVNFLWDDESETPAVERAVASLFEEVVRLGGTLSGEHGIGLTKAHYLPLEQSPELIALQRDLKRVFDPQGLLNPGKIFPHGSHRAC